MIEIKDLTKRFGDLTALDGVSFTVESGSIFGLVGSNGAGKSTLLRILAGAYRPEEGEALLDGGSPWESPEVKSRIRFVPDLLWFPAQTTLAGMAGELRGFYPSWDQGWYEQLCAMFPVEPKRKLSRLSKGLQRQAALILALASRPDLLLLDEAFDGLDPVIRHLVKRILAGEVADRRMTVLIASHNLRELEDFCDAMALLHKGGVVLEEDLDHMRLGIHQVQCVFQNMPELSQLKQKICIASSQRSGSMLTFVARGNEEEILEALDEFGPEYREIVPLSLEEVFISEMEAAGYEIENILG